MEGVHAKGRMLITEVSKGNGPENGKAEPQRSADFRECERWTPGRRGRRPEKGGEEIEARISAQGIKRGTMGPMWE